MPKQSGNPLNALRSKGFTGCLLAVKVAREGKLGASIAQTITISGTDLDVLIIHEAQRSNKRAIALLAASFTEVRVSRERAAFGQTQQTLEEKIAAFDAKVREWEAMLEENRQDVAETWLPGDELYYLDFEPGYSPRNSPD